MTLPAIITFLGLIAGLTVMWQTATLRALSSLQPEGRAHSGHSERHTIRAKRPDPYRFT
jgi:hypothetical protein